MLRKRKSTVYALICCMSLFVLGLSVLADVAVADNKGEKKESASKPKKSIAHEYLESLAAGKIGADGDHAAVSELILKRNIPIRYDYISLLMRSPNAFGPGPACVLCHSSNDVETSYRGLDLSTCEGIIAGATEAPARAILTPGKDPKRAILGRRLRNNRMPLGTAFNVPLDSKPINTIKAWITDGAKDDENFKKNVLKLFSTPNTFAPETPACTECHMSNQEPPSFHELDLSSYKGIMLGADSVAKGVANATKVIIPGKPEESGVFQHLVEDRMPPGISPTEDRDHPNTQILFRWVAQGAKCK